MLKRRSRWWSPALPLVLALTALTACASPASPPPSSTPRAPVFESEEQALAAVTAAYEEYLRVSTLILVEAGVDVERIDATVGADLADFEHGSLIELSAAGKTFLGSPTLVHTELVDWFANPDDAGVVATGRACIDMETVQVLDAAGNSTVGADRPQTRTWNVQIGPGGEDQAEFVVVDLSVAAEGASCEL